jgi:hypothetical protein
MSLWKKILLFTLAFGLGAVLGFLPFKELVTHRNAVGVLVYSFLICPVAALTLIGLLILAKRGMGKAGFRFALCVVFFVGWALGFRHIGPVW